MSSLLLSSESYLAQECTDHKFAFYVGKQVTLIWNLKEKTEKKVFKKSKKEKEIKGVLLSKISNQF